MANKKITELTEVTAPVTGDEIAIVNSSSTKRVSVDNLVWKVTDFNITTGHDHDGANSKAVDHTDCDNIGSNTHAVVDAHLASASNPHTVTASQVGNTSNQWNANKIQSVDVAVTTPTNTQVLAYNGSSLKYEPTSAAAPGAHAASHNEGGGDPITFPAWIASGETWTYASATTFTVPTDLTAKYTKGTKIQLSNDSATKYYYVVSSSYGAPNTTVTLVGEVDLANSAISSGKYSYMDNPTGFKRGEDWFVVEGILTATQALTSGAATKLDFESTVDTNSDWSDANNEYTAPMAGRYLVAHYVTRDVTSDGWTRAGSFVYNNASIASRTSDSTTTITTVAGSDVITLAKDDVVDFRAFTSVASGITVAAAESKFTINFISI